MFPNIFQLIRMMQDGLESTIKDVVKQTLLGQVKIPASELPESSSEKRFSSADTNQTQSDTPSLVNGGTAADESVGAAKPSTSPSKSGPISTKHEHRAESASHENTATASDPGSESPVNSELVEKLNWKHKCEIEAVKHNAGMRYLKVYNCHRINVHNILYCYIPC